MFLVFNGKKFLSLNENSSVGTSVDFSKAMKFKRKQAALNVAMRQKKEDNLKWIVLDASKTSIETINDVFLEEKKALEEADFFVPTKFICDKYFKKNFVFDEDIYNEEYDFFIKNKKFKNPIIMNSACIIIDNYYTYLIAQEQDIKEVPSIIQSNFYEYLKVDIQKKHEERMLIRTKVFEEANGKCLMCGKILQNENPDDIDTYMTIDHIYPKSKGGENDIKNYQCLCQRCNRIKGNIVTPYNNLLKVSNL